MESSNSRIRDVDVAKETANLARSNILNQAGVSVLSQANASPNAALKLIG
jgi:flagellin